jgi:hypothetical protein
MNSRCFDNEHRGADCSCILAFLFTGLGKVQRRSTGATCRIGSYPPCRPVRLDLQDSLSHVRVVRSMWSWQLHPQETAPHTTLTQDSINLIKWACNIPAHVPDKIIALTIQHQRQNTFTLVPMATATHAR